MEPNCIFVCVHGLGMWILAIDTDAIDIQHVWL